MTGNLDRIRKIIQEKQYLQKHFHFIENAKNIGKPNKVLVLPVALREPLGYRWRGNTSGMDNTPRGRNRWNNTRFNQRGQIMHNRIYFLDLLAQQALSAKYIGKLGELIDDSKIANEFYPKYEELQALLNSKYWDEKDGFYYDINIKDSTESNSDFNKVRTMASFWPLVAEMSTNKQAQKLANYAKDPQEFGGTYPWPALSRNDWEYDERGRYWRGGIWLPTAYMATKGLEKYGHYSIADNTAENLIEQMLLTYQNFEPKTIWEVYSPSAPKPATDKKNNKLVREDFCGWSALGPISLFLENILGFHEINALSDKIEWRIHQTCKHGIKNLYFGDTTTSLIYEEGSIAVISDKPYTLSIMKENSNQLKNYNIVKGENQYEV
jgi:mannosylglycerate hydrolase MGH1-like protein